MEIVKAPPDMFWDLAEAAWVRVESVPPVADGKPEDEAEVAPVPF